MMGLPVGRSTIKPKLLARLVGAFWRENLAVITVAQILTALVVLSGLVILAVNASMGDLLIRHAVADLPSHERVVTVVVAPERKLSLSERRVIDSTVRGRLLGRAGATVSKSGPLVQSVTRVAIFGTLSGPERSEVRVAGTQNLVHSVSLVSGRFPRTCTPSLCEVVAVDAESGDRWKGALSDGSRPLDGILIVGHATVTRAYPFVGELGAGTTEAMLIANDPDLIQNAQALALIRRVDGWTAPILPNKVTKRAFKNLAKDAASIQDSVDLSGVIVHLPTDASSDASNSNALIQSTISLLASQAIAVALIALFVIASAVSRPFQSAIARLQRRGALAEFRAQYVLAIAAAIIGPAIVLAVGLFGVVAEVGSSAEQFAFSDIFHGVFQVKATAVLLLCVATWSLGLVVALFARTRPPSRFLGVRHFDILLAVACLGVFAALKLSSPASVTADAALGSKGWSAAAWPTLAELVLAALAFRFVVPLAARIYISCSKLIYGRVTSQLNQALVSEVAAPRPGLASLAMIFAVALCGHTIATSAKSKSASLTLRQTDWESPFDYRLNVGRELVLPFQLRSLPVWANVGNKVIATDVFRRNADIVGSISGSNDSELTGESSIEILGIDPHRLDGARNWEDSYGPTQREIVSVLSNLADPSLDPVLADATANNRQLSSDSKGAVLTLDVSGNLGPLELSAIVEDSSRNWHELKFRQVEATSTYRAPIEIDQAQALVGIRVAVNGWTSEQVEHHIGEGGTFVDKQSARFKVGNLRVERFSAGSVAELPNGSVSQRLSLAGLGSGDAKTSLENGWLSVEAAIQGQAVSLLPALPSLTILAIVDPTTARRFGGVGHTFQVQNFGHRTKFRIAAVASNFPTMGASFLVADIEALRLEFNLSQPGFGTPDEMWLSVVSEAGSETGKAAGSIETKGVVSSPTPISDTYPFNLVAVKDRSQILARKNSDPIWTIPNRLLLASSRVAILLAVIAMFLAMRQTQRLLVPLRRAVWSVGIRSKDVALAVSGFVALLVLLGAPAAYFASHLIVNHHMNEVVSLQSHRAGADPLWVAVADALITNGMGPWLGVLAAWLLAWVWLLRGGPLTASQVLRARDD